MSQINVTLSMVNSLLFPNSPSSGPKLGFQTLSSPISEAGFLLPQACLHQLQDRDDIDGPASGSLTSYRRSVDAILCHDSSLCPDFLPCLSPYVALF